MYLCSISIKTKARVERNEWRFLDKDRFDEKCILVGILDIHFTRIYFTKRPIEAFKNVCYYIILIRLVVS